MNVVRPDGRRFQVFGVNFVRRRGRSLRRLDGFLASQIWQGWSCRVERLRGPCFWGTGDRVVLGRQRGDCGTINAML